MYLCYIDESGTPEIPGNTSHYVLGGIAIPVWNWKHCDNEVEIIKQRYNLSGEELHVAWMLRSYLEQSRIPNFDTLNYFQRKIQVTSYRNAELLRLQRAKNNKQYKQTKKNYQQTKQYIHLNLPERQRLVREVAQCVANWGHARLFAECIDKIHYSPLRTGKSVDEQTLEQIVSRFQQFLQNVGRSDPSHSYGLLIHDNNQTVAKKHTILMKNYHQSGTLWTDIKNIIETPLFVDSQLTGMVQIADLCSYSLRRYLENGEEDLFELIFQRADKKDGVVVGVRHFTKPGCVCKICISRRKI
jgi:Protein of unknown function (DUF3800)